jgi:hypothetical protein
MRNTFVLDGPTKLSVVTAVGADVPVRTKAMAVVGLQMARNGSLLLVGKATFALLVDAEMEVDVLFNEATIYILQRKGGGSLPRLS